MRVIVTGLTVPEKKIKAINSIRSATRLSLKEAKDIADLAQRGTASTVEVVPAYRHHLDEGFITYRVDVPLSSLIAALNECPADMRVGDLVRVLGIAVQS